MTARPPRTQAKPATARSSRGLRHPRGTGADRVYDQLKAQILDLELKPGTLLEELELSRRFGVSRSPIREALIRLAAEGLIDNPRNRTPLVAQFDVARLPAYFDALQLLYRLSARLAAGNAELVKRVADLCGQYDRHPATPAEARAILGLAAA